MVMALADVREWLSCQRKRKKKFSLLKKKKSIYFFSPEKFITPKSCTRGDFLHEEK